MLNSAKSRLKTLLLLPSGFHTPEVLSEIQELQAQVAADAQSTPKKNTSEWGANGAVVRTKKVVARRKAAGGSTFNLAGASELSLQEHQAMQATQTRMVEDDRRKALPAFVDGLAERQAQIELRRSMGDCFIKKSRLSSDNIEQLVKIDAGYHKQLLASATTITENEALNRKISYGSFPFQRGINKQRPETLGKVQTVNGTVMSLLSLVINDGYTFTPCSFDKATTAANPLVTRSTKTAINSSFSMIWMDYDDGKIGLEQLTELARRYGFISYETNSSSEQHRKYRIGWLLSAPIHARLYVQAMSFFTTLLYKETQSVDDVATREISRIYYGSKGANYHVPEQVKLYTIDEAALNAAINFRASWVKMEDKFEMRFNLGGETEIDTAALNRNIKLVAERGYAVRVKNTGTRQVYQRIIFALGQMSLDGLLAEEEAYDLWANHFEDDTGNLQGMWEYAIDETQGTGVQGIGTLAWQLREILGGDYRHFCNDESLRMPYNLSPSAKPDHTYSHISKADLPYPGSVQLEVSNTGCGKTHGTAEWLSKPETALYLKQQYMEGQEVILLVPSTLADSAKPYVAMPNSLVVDGRKIYKFRRSIDDKWTEVTQAHVDGPEAAWLAENWNNTDLLVRPNDPLNVQIALLHKLGYTQANVTKDVMTINGHTITRESEYQKNQREAQKANTGDTVLLMAAAKFASHMARMNRAGSVYRPLVIADEWATFESAVLQTTILSRKGLNTIPRTMQEPSVATVIAAINAWFDYLIAEDQSNRYASAQVADAAKWFEEHQPAAAMLLRIQGSNVLSVLGGVVDANNHQAYKTWGDANGKAAAGAVYPDAIHQKLDGTIMHSAVVTFLGALVQQLKGEKHGWGMSFNGGAANHDGPQITMQRQHTDIPEMCKSIALRIMAADCDRRWVEKITQCPVRTIAHEDFHGNTKMQNVRLHQYLLHGLSNDTLEPHTLHIINKMMCLQQPEIVWCRFKHIDLVRGLSYVQEHPEMRVCYYGSNEMTGSNTASDKNRMMFIGSPTANTHGTTAKLHALLGQAPTKNECEAFIHMDTETKYQQAIGRLRGNRRQDEMMDVMLLTGENPRFIAPCDGADTVDIEDESIWVSRTNMVDVRTVCPMVWEQIQAYFTEALAAGENNMPTMVSLCDALAISDTTFAKACKLGGHNGIKSAWEGAKLLHKLTAIAAVIDPRVLSHTDSYTEHRSSLLADIAAYKAEATRSKVELLAAACELAVRTFVEADGTYPELFFGANNLIHDIFNPQEHADMVAEWQDFSREPLMDDEERKLAATRRALRELEALLASG